MVQAIVMLVLALASFLLWGRVFAYSLLLGGLISAVPNAYYARTVFRQLGARAMVRTVKAIYMGELIKLVLMGAGFALAFTLVEPVDAIALFAGFVLVHLVGIVALVKIQAAPQQ